MRKFIQILLLSLLVSNLVKGQHGNGEQIASTSEGDYHLYKYKDMRVSIDYWRIYVYEKDFNFGTYGSYGFSFDDTYLHYTLFSSDGTVKNNKNYGDIYRLYFDSIEDGDSVQICEFHVDSIYGTMQVRIITYLARTREGSSSLKTSETKKLKIYPNPVKKDVIIDVENMNESYTYMVYDILGNAIIGGSNYKEKLELSYLKPGEYILQIETKDNTYSSQFIKL